MPLAQDDDHYTWTPVSSKKAQNRKPGQSSTGDSNMYLDLGIIDLTASVDNDNRAKARSSEVSQMQKEGDGDDSTKAASRVSQKRKRADTLQ